REAHPTRLLLLLKRLDGLLLNASPFLERAPVRKDMAEVLKGIRHDLVKAHSLGDRQRRPEGVLSALVIAELREGKAETLARQAGVSSITCLLEKREGCLQAVAEPAGVARSSGADRAQLMVHSDRLSALRGELRGVRERRNHRVGRQIAPAKNEVV